MVRVLSELPAVFWTVMLAFACGAVGIYAFLHGYWIVLSAATGSIGGLAHEFFQSRGQFLFAAEGKDGYYVGALGGMFLGGIAGVLAVEGLLIGVPGLAPDAYLVGYNAFFGGLSLKGISEAVGVRVHKQVVKRRRA